MPHDSLLVSRLALACADGTAGWLAAPRDVAGLCGWCPGRCSVAAAATAVVAIGAFPTTSSRLGTA